MPYKNLIFSQNKDPPNEATTEDTVCHDGLAPFMCEGLLRVDNKCSLLSDLGHCEKSWGSLPSKVGCDRDTDGFVKDTCRMSCNNCEGNLNI